MYLNNITIIGLLIAMTSFTQCKSQDIETRNNKKMEAKKTIEETKEYIGMWVTEDNHVRHNLLPNGRYDEARGNTESAYQGKYWVTGNHIEYKDDTGFTADGDFKDGILYHGGMILHKKED